MTVTMDIPANTAPAQPETASLCLGDSPVLRQVLSVASPAPERGSGEQGAVLIVCECRPGMDVSTRIEAHLNEFRLSGNAVGLIVVAQEVGCGAAMLAELHQAVRVCGGVPVGAGICLDAAGLIAGEDDVVFADVTDASRLVQLGRRVRALARNRRLLRGH